MQQGDSTCSSTAHCALVFPTSGAPHVSFPAVRTSIRGPLARWLQQQRRLPKRTAVVSSNSQRRSKRLIPLQNTHHHSFGYLGSLIDNLNFTAPVQSCPVHSALLADDWAFHFPSSHPLWRCLACWPSGSASSRRCCYSPVFSPRTMPPSTPNWGVSTTRASTGGLTGPISTLASVNAHQIRC